MSAKVNPSNSKIVDVSFLCYMEEQKNKSSKLLLHKTKLLMNILSQKFPGNISIFCSTFLGFINVSSKLEIILHYDKIILVHSKMMNQTEQVTSSQNVSFLLFSSPDPPVLGSDELNIYNFPWDNSSANI